MVKLALYKKKTKYLKLIRILIENDKKIALCSAISLVVGFAFLLVFAALSGTIIKTNEENVVNSYGTFLTVIPEVNKETKKAIEQLEDCYVCDYYGIVSNTEYKNTKIKIATMDETIYDILGIKKQKGDWPKESRQIVVEEYLLKVLGIENKSLPTTVTLPVAGRNVSYEVTGVISNYSYVLPTTVSSMYRYKAYPSVICGKQGAVTIAQSAIISQKKLDLKNAENDIFQILEEIPTNFICANDYLRLGYTENEDIISARWVYIVLVNMLLLFLQILVIRTFFVRNQKTLVLLSALGLDEKEKHRILAGWILSILIFSLFLSLFISGLVGNTVLQQIFGKHNTYYMQSLLRQFGAESGLLAIGLLGSVYYYKYKHGSTISIGLKNSSEKLEKKYRFKQFSVSTALLQVVCIMFATASFCFSSCFVLEKVLPNYDLYSSVSGSYKKLNNYQISHEEKIAFPFEILDELDLYRDNIYTYAVPETKNSTVLFQKDQVPPYFNQYLNSQSQMNEEEKILWNKVPDEAKQYSAIPSDDIVIKVLPQRAYLDFLKKHNVEFIKSENQLSCILKIVHYDASSSTFGLQENDDLVLGRLEEKKQNIDFCTEKFRIASILSEDDSEEEDACIQIIMSQETAKESSLIEGYDFINMQLTEHAPSQLKKEIETKIASWMAFTQGGMLDSSIKRDSEELLNRRYALFLANSMLFFGGFTIFLSISMNIYIDWKLKCREYGVLRSFGMSYATLQRKLFKRYRNSLLCSCIVSFVLAWNVFRYNEVSGGKIFAAIGITVIVTYTCLITMYWYNRKESICSMIKKED